MGYGYGVGTTVILAFIAVAILAVMTEGLAHFLQEAIQKVPFFPDKLEAGTAYLIVWGLASAICWQAGFDLFSNLGVIKWKFSWEGYLATGAMISGGTSKLARQFKLMNMFPSVISGVASMFGYGSSVGAVDLETDASMAPAIAAETANDNELSASDDMLDKKEVGKCR